MEELAGWKRFLTVVLATCLTVSHCQNGTQSQAGTTTVDSRLSQLGKDYDYIDTGVSAAAGGRKRTGAGERTKLTETSLGSPPASAPAIRKQLSGDQYDWLLNQIQRIRRLGTVDQLDKLQSQFPNFNVTELYSSNIGYAEEMDEYGYYGNVTQYEERDMEDGYFHNGTWYPGAREEDEGYFVNGTWYQPPGEMEDGYMFNGTWYPNQDELEDGYMVNGTWYPGQEEMEEGYNYNNGTLGQEEEREGEEEGEHTELMWWQLHHPRWSETGANDVSHQKSEQTSAQGKGEGHPAILPFVPVPGQRPLPPGQRPPGQRPPYQQYPPRPLQPRPHVESLPQRLPMVQHQRPPPRPYPQYRKPGTTNLHPPQHRGHIEHRPQQAGMTGNNPQPPPHPPVADNAPLTGNNPDSTIIKKKTNPLEGYGTSSTMTWGIVIACLIGFTFILAPIVCVLYKYRQEKRVKKRTFLKRQEHGSVDDGIMDAMIMTDLGEKSDSRVKKIGWGGARSKRPEKSRESSRKSSLLSLFRARSELQLASTSQTMAELGDGPEILIV